MSERWDEMKLTLWWKRERLRDYRRDHDRLKHDLATAVSRHLPARVQYAAAINVAVHATVGKYSEQVVPELAVTTMLQRWHTDHAVAG